MRLAVIPVYSAADSRFGVNHAYPWPHLLELTRKAGIAWFRDWSLKWQEVEPEKGHFTFAKTDYQIDRAQGCRLPRPRAVAVCHWSRLGAAKSVGVSHALSGEPRPRGIRPAQLGEFENYVEHTVAPAAGGSRGGRC